jgi:hypothetical protein
MQQKHPGQDIIVDVSQSAARGFARVTGVSPALCCRSIIMVQKAKRPIMPLEKLLLQGFPVHRMSLPATVSDATLGTLGGNAMHLKSVALALLVGILLTDWNRVSPNDFPSPSAPRSVAIYPLGSSKRPATRVGADRPGKRARMD